MSTSPNAVAQDSKPATTKPRSSILRRYPMAFVIGGIVALMFLVVVGLTLIQLGQTHVSGQSQREIQLYPITSSGVNTPTVAATPTVLAQQAPQETPSPEEKSLFAILLD